MRGEVRATGNPSRVVLHYLRHDRVYFWVPDTSANHGDLTDFASGEERVSFFKRFAFEEEKGDFRF